MTGSACMLDSPRRLERPWTREHVRASRADGSYVASPELATTSGLVRRNRTELNSVALTLQGRTLTALRKWSREEVFLAAVEYTAQLFPGNSSFSPAQKPEDVGFIIGGHQPTMFHPGVWVKNFVVGQIARQNSTIGLNLIVDNDTLGSTAIRVPAGNREFPHWESVPFDEPRLRQPWEEARIVNPALFSKFGEVVSRALSSWGIRPLLDDIWPAAVEHSRKSTRLADCLAAARQAAERAWGLNNLELPLSRLCELEPFLWFTSHVLAHLPRFHAIYNEVLGEYRSANKVRSRTHPVPDLRASDDWLEAPFWVWRQGDTVRNRVLARQAGRDVQLSDSREVFATLPLSPDGDACCAVKALQKLSAQGIRFRTRALSTTLFARLCLADLFVHGIGGAKYDQMTDRIIARFFGIRAPEFLTLSGTLRLPLSPHNVSPADELRLRRQLRELDFHSDRYAAVNTTAHFRKLVEEKKILIAEQEVARHNRGQTAGAKPPNALSGFERFKRLRDVNRGLAAHTRSDRQHIEDELSRTTAQLAANGVLADREYAFGLFPSDQLRQFMDHVTAAVEP